MLEEETEGSAVRAEVAVVEPVENSSLMRLLCRSASRNDVLVASVESAFPEIV